MLKMAPQCIRSDSIEWWARSLILSSRWAAYLVGLHIQSASCTYSICFFFFSESAASEDTQGEDIEGVEFEARSEDGSQSGQSLQSFFDNYCVSDQGPSFYRAMDNDADSTTPVVRSQRLPPSKKRAPESCAHRTFLLGLSIPQLSKQGLIRKYLRLACCELC
jgi:hypothetical protein